MILRPEPDLGQLSVANSRDDHLEALVGATRALHPLDEDGLVAVALGIVVESLVVDKLRCG